METIDTEKLREILEMISEYGISYFRHENLEIAKSKSTTVSGVPAQPTTSETTPNVVSVGKVSGYTKLFGGTVPTLYDTTKYIQ